MKVVEGSFRRVREGRAVALTSEPERAPERRPARVAQLLALAHHIEAAIARGDYADRADAARKLGVTRARITQILDLTLLAPDIQEAVLFLEAVGGREPVTERGLRATVKAEAWGEQRAAWR
jgi:hypothetical protein